jgi:hypothetical protein
MRVIVLLVLLGTAHADPINAVIGDASWTEGLPDRAGETARIRAHLELVLARLRAADTRALSADQRRDRAQSLAALERYVARGEFPHRTDDAYPGRRPRFIDERGIHCAVAALLAASGDEVLARAIAGRYEYAYIGEIAEPALVAWADAHGFTLAELAMIQPQYTRPPTEDSTRRRLIDSADRLALTCGEVRPWLAKVPLHVEGDDHAHIAVTTHSREPFARCIAEHVAIGAGAMRGTPRPFAYDLVLAPRDPQTQLQAMIGGLGIDRRCTPRPGPLVREVTVRAETGQEGLAVTVATRPENAEVAACVEQYARHILAGLAGVHGLHAEHREAIATNVTSQSVRGVLDKSGAGAIWGCDRSHIAPVPVTASAHVDDPRFAITVDAEPELARCIAAALQGRLHDAFARGPEFRIDGDASASATIQIGR